MTRFRFQSDGNHTRKNIVTGDTFDVQRRLTTVKDTKSKNTKLEWIRTANRQAPLLQKVKYRPQTQEDLNNLSLPTKTELSIFLHQNIDGVDAMVVKDNETLVLDSMWAALNHGITDLDRPGGEAMKKLSRIQLQYIFATLINVDKPVTDTICRMHIEKLVDSWTSCTTEQVRCLIVVALI